VVTDLLVGLRDRGLEATRPILVVIDGAKALRRAVADVFNHPVVQRCQLHKLRNVTDRLPDAVASTVAKRLRADYHNPDPLLAQAELETLTRELHRSHPGAAASLREGLAETLTIIRLGVPPTLARTLRSTNSILGVLPLGAGAVAGGGLGAPQHDHVVVVAQDVVDLRRRLGRLGLVAEVLQHLGLALIGSGPLAVAADVPDHVVGQVLVHPGGVAPLERLEAFPDDGDVGMLVVGHGDSFRRRPLTWTAGSLPWSAIGGI
jgi:Transposase, Mutator family